jgi:tRNA (guanine37-N1)-methyltransferase
MRKHLREILSKALPSEDLAYVHNSYDILGDIAILRLTDTSRKHAETVAQAIMDIHKNVKTVFAQTSPVHGDFRLRGLEHIAGEDRTVTVHRESGCQLLVDVAKCYFSPRLHYERIRIARQVRNGEVIVNMFAGVGSFSIVIARNSNAKKIYSADINQTAVKFMNGNVRLNRVYDVVKPMLGDAREITKELHGVADRVLMPLPEKALQYLPSALPALKKTGGWIHYYDFEHADKNEDPTVKVKTKVANKLQNLRVPFETKFSRIVRSVGPRWYQIVLDIEVKPRNE